MAEFNANQILGEWVIESITQDGISIVVTTESKFTFFSGSKFIYHISTAQPEDASAEYGIWKFDSQKLSLTLSFESQIRDDAANVEKVVTQELVYEIVNLSETSMHWIISDANRITARIELTKSI